jgi:glycosyltransferase involved in cell wall biosynthesis
MSGRRHPVVLMAHDYPPLTGGGLALGVREIAAALQDEFVFRVLSSRRRDHFADDGDRLPLSDTAHESVATLATPHLALRWLREADVIMLHWTFSFRRLSTALLLVAPVVRRPTVLVVQTAPDHCRYNRMRRLPPSVRRRLVSLACAAARRCSAVVALSPAHAAELADAGFPAARVAALPVATDPYRCARRGSDRRPLQTLMILGELSELKGSDAIPDLVAVLASEFAIRIVGRGPLSPLVAATTAALPPEHRTNVTISDAVEPSRVPQLYDETDCLLVLSRAEAQSRVTLEAMLSGVIVLARPVGGIRDLISDGTNGFLIDPDDPESVRNIVAWLAQNPAEADLVRRRARATATRAYATSREQWRSVLADVTSSRPTSETTIA